MTTFGKAVSPCYQGNYQVLPTAEQSGGSGQMRCLQVCAGRCHGRPESEEELVVGRAKHLHEAPKQKEADQDLDAAAERLLHLCAGESPT